MEQELSASLITKITNLLDISGARHVMNQFLMGPSAAKGHIFYYLHLGHIFLG